ncbi:MAG: arginase [Pseudomonadota bacterium]
MTTCILLGAPVDTGSRRPGCRMGPDAFRIAGLADALTELGLTVEDRGAVLPGPLPNIAAPPHLYALPETVAWTEALTAAASDALADGLSLFLGGDHSLSAGTVAGTASRAATLGRPLFLLWLDAHADFHALDTTASGNLHGTPLAYVTGQPGFDAFPRLATAVPEENVCVLGLRSVDPAERTRLMNTQIDAHDMRDIDENGIAAPLRAFLARVRAANGLLHVSLDVDFLDPDIAPAVGTTVPGGATLREAHLAMELVHESGTLAALDLVELNPFLDERGRTARIMVDLAASALGRTIFDRPTTSFA